MRRALIAALLTIPAAASADAGDTARSVGGAIGYAVPAIGAALTTFANGTALAYDEPSTIGWRVAGWIAGGVEVAIGTGMLLTYNENRIRIGLGVVPVALGVAALATATFVASEEVAPPPQVAVTPVVWPGGGGAAVAGRSEGAVVGRAPPSACPVQADVSTRLVRSNTRIRMGALSWSVPSRRKGWAPAGGAGPRHG